MILVRSKLKQLYKDLKLLNQKKKTKKSKSSRITAFGVIICDNTNKNVNFYNNLLDSYIHNQLETKKIEEQLTNVERGLLDTGCSKERLKQLYDEYKSNKSESEKRKPFGDVSNVNKVSKYQNSIWHR